jgi:hypothetical protein
VAALQGYSAAQAFDPQAIINYLEGKLPSGSGGGCGGIICSTGSGTGTTCSTGYLFPGSWLRPGSDLWSSCSFDLSMQNDGNLVLYASGPGAPRSALWSSGTGGQSTQGVIMQTDGNLVIYSPSGVALWASNTVGHPNASLTVQSDGNAVIYPSGGGPALWATNTGGSAGEGLPPSNWSFYIRTTDNGTFYNMGCNQGRADTANGLGSEVVLDFGGQTADNTGTLLARGTAVYVTYAQVESLATSFANGYWDCSSSSPVLKLGIGTNNSGGSVNSAGGAAWRRPSAR